MNTLEVTLSDLIDRAYVELQSPDEAPRATTLSSTITTGSTTLQVTDAANMARSDVLEIDGEMMLVTAVSADAVPVITVARSYYTTTAASHTAGAIVEINPRHPRFRIAESIRRSFPTLEALGLPLVETGTFNRATGLRYLLLPEETRDVRRVAYIASNGHWHPLDRWEFIDAAPTARFGGSKVLRTPSYVMDADDLEVTYTVPYRWSTHPAPPSEAATITMIEGSEHLPAMYAVAWQLGSREWSRGDIDRSVEWNQGEPSRGGVTAGQVRLAWQNFYRALDEARRLTPGTPMHRPYIRMPRL
jgi:hypothetical protein